MECSVIDNNRVSVKLGIIISFISHEKGLPLEALQTSPKKKV